MIVPQNPIQEQVFSSPKFVKMQNLARTGVQTNTMPMAMSSASNSKMSPSVMRSSKDETTITSTHVINLKVLGLAGISVDSTQIKNAGRKKQFPPPPNKMRAVIAVSRNHQIKATTALSKPLARSPGDDGAKSLGDDTWKSQGRNKNHRYLAVWTSEDDNSLGSILTFEAPLDRLEVCGSHEVSSSTIPKSFELTVALTEGTGHERKVALPIGLANLNISGEQSGPIVLDLPILNLKQANPTGSDENGLGGFQMISIQQKPFQTIRKKSGFGRLLGRNSTDKHQKIPSVPERKIFSSVYSTDSNGDAILRVLLDVAKKETTKSGKIARDSTTLSQDVSSDAKMRDREYVMSEKVYNPDNFGSPSCGNVSLQSDSVAKGSKDTATTQSFGTSSVSSDGSGTWQTFDNTIEASEKSPSEGGTLPDRALYRAVGSNDEDYTLSFEPKSNADYPQRGVGSEPETFKFFGHRMDMPNCGQMAYSDDMTHITGDFFGREVPIPICAALKTHLDDNETFAGTYTSFSTYTDQRTAETHRNSVLKDFFRTKQTSKLKGSVESALKKVLATEKEDDNGGAYILGPEYFSTSPHKTPLIHGVEPPRQEREELQLVEEEIRDNDLQRDSQRSKSKGVKPKRASSVADSIAAIFQCTSRSTVDDLESNFSPLASSPLEIPGSLEIPNELESVGDLTAITLQDLRSHMVMKRKSAQSEIPIPIALGGNGMCSNMHLVDDAELVGTVDSVTGRSNESLSQPVLKDNYFEDYDNYSFERPRSQESIRSVRRALT